MEHVALHLAAVGLDHRRGIGLERLAEGVVCRQKEPGLAALLHDRLAGAVRQRIGVVRVVHHIRIAGFVGEGLGGAPGVDKDALLFGGDLADGESDAGGRNVDDHVHALRVIPLARLGRAHVGLVLVVGGQYFNRFAQHLAAEVLHRHLRRQKGARPADVGI